MGKSGYVLRRLRARVADRPTGFLWVRKGELATAGFPSSKQQVDWVRSQGISRILTLTESPLPSRWTEGIESKHVPMRDHEPPTFESLAEASSYVEESVTAGKPVLVHCLAGQGRTMCVAAAYLIRKGSGVGEAVTFLRRLRPGAVENGQEVSLREFAERLGAGSSRKR